MAVAGLMLTSCAKDYDDDLATINKRVDNLEGRVSALEQWHNDNIDALQQIINIQQSGSYISAITPLASGDGYVMTFGNGQTFTVHDGKDGQDGHSPIIGVRQDTDGIYYWTLDGEWLLDADGQKVRTTGKDGRDGQNGQNGQDGQTPTITINADGYWVINGVNTGVKAQGVDGLNGQDGQTPTITIDADGYWVINGVNTGVKAQGEDGQNGHDGQNGQDGQTPTITINADGYWVINGVNTGVKARGEDGQNGQDGQTPTITINADGYWVINGVNTGVKAQGLNGQDGQDGITPQIRINPTTFEWEISLDNGTTWTSTGIVAKGQDGTNGTNGTDGEKGDKGDQGEKGDKGDQGEKGDKGDQGEKGDKGDTGDAFFQSVTVDEAGGKVTFTLADGTTFELPYFSSLQAVKNRLQSMVFIPDNVDGMMTLQNGVQTTVRYRVMPEAVAEALATSYASTLSFIGEEVAVTRAATTAGIAINSVTNEGNGRLALTVTPTGMTAGQGYAFALVMNDGTSMYSTAYTSVFHAIPPVAIGIAADGILAGKGNVSVGSTVRLIALLVPTDTNMKGVQWTSSDASVVTVDANGLVTAHNNGTATVTVTSTADPTVSKSITITVSDGTITLNTDELVSQSEAE